MSTETNLDYATLQYYVEGVEVNADTALKLWKQRFETLDVVIESLCKLDPKLGDFITEQWLDIPEVTVAEAFTEKNIEVRRLYFQAIGVEKLMQSLKPELLDERTITKQGKRWDVSGNMYVHKYEDTYGLYKLDGNLLFPEDAATSWQIDRSTLYVVKCKCATTDREYWIYVQKEFAFDGSHWNEETRKPNAIKAIASTFRLPITFPKAIYRQGDVLIVEPSEKSQELLDGMPQTPITEEEYLTLLQFES
jgi:hypothetical protein